MEVVPLNGEPKTTPTSHRRWTAVLPIALLLALGASLWARYEGGYDKPLDMLATAGAFASTFGLIIVLVQISALRSSSRAAHHAARTTRTQLIRLLSALDIARTVKVLQEIQVFIRSKKFEIAILRMQDVKYVLGDIVNNKRVHHIAGTERYRKHINEISLQIGSLEKEIWRPTKNFNTARTNEVFEHILSDLMELDSRWKQLGEHDG